MKSIENITGCRWEIFLLLKFIKRLLIIQTKTTMYSGFYNIAISNISIYTHAHTHTHNSNIKAKRESNEVYCSKVCMQ